MTAAKIIVDRGQRPQHGIQNFVGNLPTVPEAKVGKNSLDREESFALRIPAEQFLLYVQ
jgi:hypothetical protein